MTGASQLQQRQQKCYAVDERSTMSHHGCFLLTEIICTSTLCKLTNAHMSWVHTEAEVATLAVINEIGKCDVFWKYYLHFCKS